MCSNNVTVAHLQKSQVLSSDAFPMNKTEFDSVYRILLFFRYALHLLCTLYFGCFIIWRHKCMADIYNTFNSQRKCGRHTFSIFGKKKRRYAALNKYIFDHSGKKNHWESAAVSVYLVTSENVCADICCLLHEWRRTSLPNR